MRLFRRQPSEPEAGGDFWSWWASGRDRLATAIASGAFDGRLISEINAAVQTIHPAMAWELAPGKAAQHALCISPEGNAELRQAAQRWLASAPPADGTWEYYASKQAAAQLGVIEVGTERFELQEMRAVPAWDATRRRVHVRLWHPQFSHSPDKVRLQVAFIFLDQLLGEDEVERWVGTIDILEAAANGLTPDDFSAELARRRSEPAGDETWVVATLTRPDGSPVFVLADASLKRIDHPFADLHATITLLFGAERLPTDAEAQILNDEEDDFLRRLGDAAIYAGRVTQPGSRTWHFVTQDAERMKPAIDGWAQDMPYSLSEGLPQRRLKVNFGRDMNWSFQRDFGVR